MAALAGNAHQVGGAWVVLVTSRSVALFRTNVRGCDIMALVVHGWVSVVLRWRWCWRRELIVFRRVYVYAALSAVTVRQR